MANDNFETLWFQTNANKLATNRARQIVDQLGSALPCRVQSVTGSLVTVAFECTFTVYQNGQPIQVTLPPITMMKAESQWLRAPTQPGDFGITVPADTFLGVVSGTGSGTANLNTGYGNLSTLVWVPIGNVNFTAAPNANAPWVNGPDGAIISDTNQTVVSIYDPTGKAISHIVPASGGLLGLGALASSLSTTNNAAQRYSDQVAFAASIKKMVGDALQQSAQAAITAGVTNATAWLAEIQSGLPSFSFTDLTGSIASLAAPAGSATVLIK